MKQNQKFKIISEHAALTNEDMDRFRQAIQGPKALAGFLKDIDFAVHYLQALCNGNKHMQDFLLEILLQPDCVFELVKKGKINEVWNMLEGLSLIQQKVTLLSAPEIVYILAKNGKANQLRELILSLPDTDQAMQICTVPYALFGLIKYSDPLKCLSLIQSFQEVELQVAILSTAQVVYGFSSQLNDKDLEQLIFLISSYSKNQQADILASYMAILGLIKNGKSEQVLVLLKSLSTAQLEQVRNAPYVVFTLLENIDVSELTFFVKQTPPKREFRSKDELLLKYRSSQTHLH